MRRPALPLQELLPSRRHLLTLGAFVLLALLAGCSAPGSLTMDPVTDAQVVEHASRSLDRSAPPAEDDEEARMLRDAIENGSATIDSPSPPVREGKPFEHEGAFYDLTWTVVDERTETSVSLLVDYNASDPSGERVAYEDLPAADRRAVDALLPPRENRQVEGYDLGASSRYNDSELERSVLVSDQPTVVVYEGEAYLVKFDGTSEFTVHTYSYETTKIADSPDEYASDLKEQHLFTLDGLTDAERAVVDESIEEGSYHAEDDDEAFRSVLEQFSRHEAIASEEAHGEWLVRYDGEVYWAELRYDGFDVDGTPGASSGSGRERTEQE